MTLVEMPPPVLAGTADGAVEAADAPVERLEARLATHSKLLETHAAALGAVGAQLERFTAAPPAQRPPAAALARLQVTQWM